MKLKKLVSVMSAAAILAGFAAMPSAMAEGVELVYAGADNKTVEGVDGKIDVVKYKFDESLTQTTGGAVNYNNTVFTFGSNVSDDIKMLFADSEDGTKVDSIYTSVKLNYIGGKASDNRGNVSPSITVDLEAGSYRLYYVGGSGTIGSVDAVGTDREVVAMSSQQQIADNLYIYPIDLYLLEPYNGDIKFVANDNNSWLPDLYSVKIVDGEPMKTQDDVITALNVTRASNRTNNNAPVTEMSWNDAYNGSAKTIFGGNFENAGNVQLTYTDTTDYYYINVTNPGSYKMYILGATSKNTDVKISKIDGSVFTSYTVGNIVSDSVGSGLTLYEYETVDFDETGFYKIELSKTATDSYYTNFIAAAFEEVTEPEPIAPTAEITDIATSTAGDGKATAIKSHISTNDYNVNALKWTITDSELGTGTIDRNITTISGDADVVLYITGYILENKENVDIDITGSVIE